MQKRIVEITIKHYALHKRADRDDLIKHLLDHIEKGPALAKANAKKAKEQNLPKNPTKESKLMQIGD